MRWKATITDAQLDLHRELRPPPQSNMYYLYDLSNANPGESKSPASM